MTGQDVAETVVPLQQQAQAQRIFRHHVIEHGVQLDLIGASTAREAEALVGSLMTTSFTPILRQIGYRPRHPQNRDGFHQVLHDDEVIAASCYEDGYLTFATDSDSADRMYADHEPLRDLWRALMEDSGPADLTMIKGRVLAVIDPAIGTGPEAGHRYQPLMDASSLNDDDLRDHRQRHAKELVAELGERLLAKPFVTDLDLVARRVLDGALGAMERALDSTRGFCAPAAPEPITG
jgi:hypothetical protein